MKLLLAFLNCHITMKISLFFLLLFLLGTQSTFAQTQKIKQEKLTRFELQSTELIQAPGEIISTAAYRSGQHPCTCPAVLR